MRHGLVVVLFWWLLAPMWMLGWLLFTVPEKPRKAKLQNFSDVWVVEEMKQ